MHYGQIIRDYRHKHGWAQQELASHWPSGLVTVRYVQKVESGDKRIANQQLLRQISDLLEIPPALLGLSVTDPLGATTSKQGYIVNATLNLLEQCLSQTWQLRRSAPIPVTEQSILTLQQAFDQLSSTNSIPSRLETRYLRAYALTLHAAAIMYLERQDYPQALKHYILMHKITKGANDPSLLALALTGIGAELERAGRQMESVRALERAATIGGKGAAQVHTLALAYLARAYASNHQPIQFHHAIAQAIQQADQLGSGYGDGTYTVYHNIGGLLAELSYGLLDIGEPQHVLDLAPTITKSIDPLKNAWLYAWIPLDWARAHLMLGNVEESIANGRIFYQRASALQSPHAISRAHVLADAMKEKFGNMSDIQFFRDELNSTK